MQRTHRAGILYQVPRKWRVDDKVAVVGDDRSRFCFRHAKRCVGRAEDLTQVLQNLGIRERDDLDRYALSKLDDRRGEQRIVCGEEVRGERTHILAKILAVFSVVGYNDEPPIKMSRTRIISKRDKHTFRQPLRGLFLVNGMLHRP
jgi:hypothetical protein